MLPGLFIFQLNLLFIAFGWKGNVQYSPSNKRGKGAYSNIIKTANFDK
jgi:hypothetical protein